MGHFSEFIYQNIGCNLLGKCGRKCLGEERGESHVPKEGKEKVPNPVLSLEEIEKSKGMLVQPSSKHCRFLTAEKKFDLFVESCR